MTSTPSSSSAPLDPPIDQLAVWQVLAARRETYDSMMWQTPSLGLTAQAFLLTLSLGSGVSPTSRCLAALLSFIISIMVLQLMSKHRHFEGKDSRLLEAMEKRLGFESVLGHLPHGSPETRYPPHIAKMELPHFRAKLLHFVISRSSYVFWMVGQSAFAIIAIFIVATVLTGHQEILGGK